MALQDWPRWIRGPLCRIGFMRRWLVGREVFAAYPPDHTPKLCCVLDYADRLELTELVETGTFNGLMVAGCRGSFVHIHSVELSREHAKDTTIRFAKFPHITIYQGNSAEVLPGILKTLVGPTLFWLDAHYSGGRSAKGPQDTPIMMELRAIFSQPPPRFAILIDDARHFVGKNDYPTVEEVRSLLLSYRPDWRFEVRKDIIRFVPPGDSAGKTAGA